MAEREGLAGVVVAGLVASGLAPKAMAPRLGGWLGETTMVFVILATCAFLWNAGRKRS